MANGYKNLYVHAQDGAECQKLSKARMLDELAKKQHNQKIMESISSHIFPT